MTAIIDLKSNSDWGVPVSRQRVELADAVSYHHSNSLAHLPHLHQYPAQRQHFRGYNGRSAQSNQPYYRHSESEQSHSSSRKRIAVACGRCRKRKIKCSGDKGDGKGCANCQSAGSKTCIFHRVGSQDFIEIAQNSKEMGQHLTDDINAYPASAFAGPSSSSSQYYLPYNDSYERVNAAYNVHQMSVVTRSVDHHPWPASGYDSESPVSPVESYRMPVENTTASNPFHQAYLPNETVCSQWHSEYALPHRPLAHVHQPLYAQSESDLNTPASYLLHLSANPRSNITANSSHTSLQAYSTGSTIPGGDRMLPMPPPLRPRSSLPTHLNDISAKASALSMNSPASYYPSYPYNNGYEYPSKIPQSPLIRSIGIASSYATSDEASNADDCIPPATGQSSNVYQYNINGLPRNYTEYPQTYAELSAVRDSYKTSETHHSHSSRQAIVCRGGERTDFPRTTHTGSSFSSTSTVSAKSSSDSLCSSDSTLSKETAETSATVDVSQPQSMRRYSSNSTSGSLRNYYLMNGHGYAPVSHHPNAGTVSSLRASRHFDKNHENNGDDPALAAPANSDIKEV